MALLRSIPLFTASCFLFWFAASESDAQWVLVSLLQDRKIVVFQRDANDGRLTRRSETRSDAEPAFLCASPDGRRVFAALRSTGQLASYAFDDENGRLSLLNVVDGGDDPAFLRVDQSGRFLMSAYYVANKVTLHAIDNQGSLSDSPSQSVETAARAHGVTFGASNRMVFVPHTGANRIYQFRFDPERGKLTPSDPPFVALPDGQAPRHLVMHPSNRWAYANSEAGDALTAFEVDPDAATLRRIESLPTIPSDFDGKKNATSKCAMTTDGRFVYVANRGHDSIAAFAVDQTNGRMKSLGTFRTAKTPRGFGLSKDGRFLYVAGQGDGKLIQYGVRQDGTLRRENEYEVGTKAWSVLVIEQ